MSDNKQNLEKTANQGGQVDALLCTDHVELKEICDLTIELIKLRQNECKHLCIENYAPEVFEKLIEIAIRYKVLKGA